MRHAWIAALTQEDRVACRHLSCGHLSPVAICPAAICPVKPIVLVWGHFRPFRIFANSRKMVTHDSTVWGCLFMLFSKHFLEGSALDHSGQLSRLEVTLIYEKIVQYPSFLNFNLNIFYVATLSDPHVVLAQWCLPLTTRHMRSRYCLPVTFGRKEIRHRGSAQCVSLIQTHRLVCNMAHLAHHVTLTCGQILALTFQSHFAYIRLVPTRKTR